MQGILDNDFYIGTFRQGKYTRAKINGKDLKRDEGDHIVIENHHQPIIDYRTFATTMALRESRSQSHYRGVKKNDTVYSGFLSCGDCGSPMFAMSRSDLQPAYTCGSYHRRGRAACSSHHIRVDKLDEILKNYVRKVKENCSEVLQQLNEDLKQEEEQVTKTEESADRLAEIVEELKEELKITKRQRVRDILKHPEQEGLLTETYDEMESELQKKIQGLNHQIDMIADRRNTILRVNRVAKTAMDVFDEILAKEKLERTDLELIIKKVCVFEDRLEIHLQADVDALLQVGVVEEAINFNPDIKNSLPCRLVQSAERRSDKVFDVHVVSNGDPLEIYTDADGEVIFKKYSPMGDLSEFAMQICESMHKTLDHAAAVCDRDSVIAAAGPGKRELLDKHISPALAELMEARRPVCAGKGTAAVSVVESHGAPEAVVAVPILCEGDVLGCVLLLEKKDAAPGETELKLCTTVAGFLGKQMES